MRQKRNIRSYLAQRLNQALSLAVTSEAGSPRWPMQWLRCFSNAGPIRFLNSFTDSLFTITEGRKFHKEITPWEKKYFFVFRRTWFFTSRIWCPLVLSKLVLNSRSDGNSSKPFIILHTSTRSVPCLLISSEKRFALCRYWSYGMLARPIIICVIRLCAF